MPAVKRPRVEPTDDWRQLQLLAPFPEQRAYELRRPVVLFGHSPAERPGQTGTAERTLYRRAARFDAEGMTSLFPAPKAEKHRRLPAKLRQTIRDLKAEYPPFHAHEIAGICETRFGHRPSPHTVRRVLAEEPPTPAARRRFPPYHDIADAAERRIAVIRLHSEGWPVKSIAAYLDVSRQQVYLTLRRWIAEGVAGLDDKSRARHAVPRKVYCISVIAGYSRAVLASLLSRSQDLGPVLLLLYSAGSFTRCASAACSTAVVTSACAPGRSTASVGWPGSRSASGSTARS